LELQVASVVQFAGEHLVLLSAHRAPSVWFAPLDECGERAPPRRSLPFAYAIRHYVSRDPPPEGAMNETACLFLIGGSALLMASTPGPRSASGWARSRWGAREGRLQPLLTPAIHTGGTTRPRRRPTTQRRITRRATAGTPITGAIMPAESPAPVAS